MSLAVLMRDRDGEALVVRLRELLRRWYVARAEVANIERDLQRTGDELRHRGDEVGITR